MILGYSGSGMVWFRWMRNLGFSLWPAFISSLFYLLAPYRLVNIFVRGALGEHLGFLLFPLVMLAATKMWTGRSWRYVPPLALAVAGLILVHNLSALMYLPLLGLIPIFLHIDRRSLFNRSKLLAYLAGTGLGLALSAFFWLPAIMESKYTLSSWIFSAKDWYADNFLSARQLVWSPWGYGWSQPGDDDGMSFQIGIPQLVAFLVSIGWILTVTFRRSLAVNWQRLSYRIAVFGLVCVLGGAYLALPISAMVWKAIPLMEKFQFPWRFLAYTIIGSSLSIAVVAEIVKANRMLLAVMIMAPLLFTVNYWKIAGPSDLTEKFLAEDYVGTTDTGETSPIWAIRFQEKFPNAPIEVVSATGEVQINLLEKLYQRHEFTVTATHTAQIVDNTLYFPGWKVYVDGVPVPIEYQDENWRGLITFPVPAGAHQVKIVFEETLTRKIANATSIIGIVILAAWQLGSRSVFR